MWGGALLSILICIIAPEAGGKAGIGGVIKLTAHSNVVSTLGIAVLDTELSNYKVLMTRNFVDFVLRELSFRHCNRKTQAAVWKNGRLRANCGITDRYVGKVKPLGLGVNTDRHNFPQAEGGTMPTVCEGESGGKVLSDRRTARAHRAEADPGPRSLITGVGRDAIGVSGDTQRFPDRVRLRLSRASEAVRSLAGGNRRVRLTANGAGLCLSGVGLGLDRCKLLASGLGQIGGTPGLRVASFSQCCSGMCLGFTGLSQPIHGGRLAFGCGGLIFGGLPKIVGRSGESAGVSLQSLLGGSSVVGGNRQEVRVRTAALHLVKLEPKNEVAGYGACDQDCGEYANAARPARHHPLVMLVLGWSLLVAAVGAVLLAFKSAEYADDHGWPWWLPGGACLLGVVVLVGQGLRFLGT